MLVLDFESLLAVMAEGLASRMLIEHKDAQGQSAKHRMSQRQFILTLRLHKAEEMKTAGFGLYWAESAREISDKGDLMIVQDLLMIDMAELVRPHICEELDDTWAWVSPRPKRQPDASVGGLEVAEGAHDVDEGA
nr:hypothetical protein [Tanacetum cinerariifolium]